MLLLLQGMLPVVSCARSSSSSGSPLRANGYLGIILPVIPFFLELPSNF